MVLDALFAPFVIDSDPDPSSGPLAVQLLLEILQLGPWFLVAWLLINLPVLLPSSHLQVRSDDAVVVNEELVNKVPKADPALPPRTTETVDLISDQDSVSSLSTRQENELQRQQFLLNLPGVIGTDLIAVSSDLHYLNVWTVSGRTTVLGSLRDVVDELSDVGMQVHRSRWIAHSHVRRIVGNSKEAACIMSNELRVPVSRRRWKSVREHYGRGVVHTS